MAEITATIENVCRTYLEQREDNAWDLRAKGPLGHGLFGNHWAQKALEELFFPQGYNRMKEADEEKPEEGADFIRCNSDKSIDRVFLEDPLKIYEQKFGNRDSNLERKNIVAHLRFVNTEEAEKYKQLEDKMYDISEQEGITHRGSGYSGGGEYRPLYAFFGGVAGGGLSCMLAAASIPWKELIGLEPRLADAFVTLFLLTAGAVGGWYIGKHKMDKLDKMEEYRTKLKKDYSQLFQEFKDTFGARFTYGKDALSAALEVKS